ncbi:MAG: GyrI-like domain-containing protein [Clostridiales bacterium]|nr:GyrI-like domain-containing protein [Clostridiales bacterium]
MEKKQEFKIEVVTLEKPMYIVGRSVRVTHGTPECFPSIDSLKTGFKADDIPAKIPNKKEPVIRFGICYDHHVPREGLIEFTYMVGVEVNEPINESLLPETTHIFTIPTGVIVRIKVSAPNFDTAIGIAYVELDQWRKNNPEWEGSDVGEIELYVDESPSWVEFEKWDCIRKKQ